MPECQYTVVEEDYAAISSVLTSHRHGDVGSAAKYSGGQPPGDCQLIAVCWDRVSIDRLICNCERLRAGMRTEHRAALSPPPQLGAVLLSAALSPSPQLGAVNPRHCTVGQSPKGMVYFLELAIIRVAGC